MNAFNTIAEYSSHASQTVHFYDVNASQYAISTLDVDMSNIYKRFLKYLKPGSRILDAGSGSGRDTREFLKRGYIVEAFDGSTSLAAISSKLTGIKTRVLRFEDYNDKARFDGIWSCAALLHVPRTGLSNVLTNLIQSLTVDGVLYASFKFGTEEKAADDGRYFTDLNEASLRDLLKQVKCKLQVREVWVAKGAGDRYGQITWINTIIQRCE
jgi:SAM-dependent methyltransferase